MQAMGRKPVSGYTHYAPLKTCILRDFRLSLYQNSPKQKKLDGKSIITTRA